MESKADERAKNTSRKTKEAIDDYWADTDKKTPVSFFWRLVTYFFAELVSLLITRVKDRLSAFSRSFSAFNFCNC